MAKKRKTKAASGRAQPRLTNTRLVSGDRVWGRPSGAQKSKSGFATEVERTNGGQVTIRTKSAAKPKTRISRRRSKRGGPR